MFSTLKQRTIAIYHILTTRKPHLGAFVFISILFLGGYLLAGVYASDTGRLSMFMPQVAMAEDPKPATAPDAGAGQTSSTDGVGIFMTAVIKILLFAASWMLKMAIFCLFLIIQVAGYNGYLDSTAVNIGWVMVRDITNMFFVVILLLVAFGTILGLEQYEWKKMLVKFFFAAVLVNFSRIICGVIIDVGQVVMITFVNGIAATAGGNLINAFSMDKILGISAQGVDVSKAQTGDYFIAALGAIVFASIILAMMMVFVFMLISRMIVLWILIVLSPFAFVLSVIPQTQKYASQWWSEFGNHVIVGPAVVFFLWLSFAVVGSGKISNEIIDNSAVPPQIGGEDAAGVGGTMGWNSMTNFAIAIGILLVGAKTSQSLGTVGGSAMSKATDFGKKVAMIGSGVAAGMWVGGKAKQGAVGAAKLAGKGLYTATLSNTVAQTKLWGERQLEGYRSWRAGGPKPKMEVDAEGNEVQVRDAKTGALVFDEVAKRGLIGRYLGGRQESLLKSEKLLEKVKGQRTVREDLIKSRAGAVPTYLFQKLEGPAIHDLDRMEQGQLDAEKERSAAKTSQFKAEGRALVLSGDRFKGGKWQTQEEADRKGEKYKGTMAEQTTVHKEKALAMEAQIKGLFAVAATSSGNAKKAINAKIKAEMKAEVDVKQAELQSGGMKLHYLQKAEGAGLLARKTAIGAEEKEEHAKVEALEKEAAATFETSPDGKGKHFREGRIAAENRGEIASNVSKRAEAESRIHSILDASGAIKPEYARVLETQNMNKILEDTLGSVKTKQSEDSLGAIIDNSDPAFTAYAQASARQKDSAKQFRVKQNTVMSRVAQETVHGNRGISVPTDAITAGIEEYEKEFSEMEYNRTVSNIRGNFKSVLGKKSRGEKISDGDKQAMAGLFKHAFNNSWVDDGIISIMTDPELASQADQAFGWKDQEFTPEKINQLQSLWASGGDWEFAQTHSSVAKMMDTSRAELGDNFNMPEFLNKWKTGGFSAQERTSFTKAGANLANVDGKHDSYMTTTRENQAQLQMMGNLRDAAISKNHPENADHSQYVKTDTGEELYMMVSSGMAKAATNSDLNKTDVRLRAKMHSHSAGNIDEETGVLTEVRAKDYQLVRKGIKGINDYRGTNGRWQNQFAGLAATEDATNFKDAGGTFLVTGLDRSGKISERVKSHGKRKGFVAKDQIGQQKEAINDLVNKVFIPQMQENMEDFLLTMAAQSGVTDKEALETGKMNIKIMTKDGEKLITNVNDLIVRIKNGEFGGSQAINNYKGGPIDTNTPDQT